jgi:hypothetical protein
MGGSRYVSPMNPEIVSDNFFEVAMIRPELKTRTCMISVLNAWTGLALSGNTDQIRTSSIFSRSECVRQDRAT